MGLFLCLGGLAYGTRRCREEWSPPLKRKFSGTERVFGDKVELILEDRSINVDRRTAEGKMAAFFFPAIRLVDSQ